MVGTAVELPTYVAMMAGGMAASSKAAAELAEIGGCEVTDVQAGRVFFHNCESDAIRAVTAVQRVNVVILRQTEGVVERFLDFEGATQAEALRRITAALLVANWALPLAAWSRATGHPNPLTDPVCRFKLVARRTTKTKGKRILPSDVMSREVGGEIARRFGWSVSCGAPSIEICLRLSCDELLVFIPTWVQRAGGNYLSSAGLHPCVAWAVARTADIQPGDTVLDPMCGKGVLLCEAAVNWPAARYIGCDLSAAQLHAARANISGAHASNRIGLQLGDASKPGGLPLRDSCVDRVITDFPFGKQYGSVAQNERLYPRALAELARVVRVGGVAVILTSAENSAIMQAALASVVPTQVRMEARRRRRRRRQAQLGRQQPASGEGGDATDSNPSSGSDHDGSNSGGNFQAGVSANSPRTAGSSNSSGSHSDTSSSRWEVVHRYGFMLFYSMRARLFVLRRTTVPAPSPDAAEASCRASLDVLKAWAHRSRLLRQKQQPPCSASANAAATHAQSVHSQSDDNDGDNDDNDDEEAVAGDTHDVSTSSTTAQGLNLPPAPECYVPSSRLRCLQHNSTITHIPY